MCAHVRKDPTRLRLRPRKRELKEEAGEAATYGNHENPQTNIQILREND